MIRVLFVCLGNICRSPMAEAVFQEYVDEAGLTDAFEVDSAGTGSWHVGEPAHRGTLTVLRRHGIAYDGRARQVQPTDLAHYDYVIALAGENARDLRRLDRSGVLDGKLYQLMDFTPPGYPRDVPDPYYNGRFDEVYDLVDAGAAGLLDHIRAEHELA
ncbi:MAG: low molecular weight phosphotyrosine protein phosphatase [Anaerolineae bacterium]|nr:low molecular weight phosphotyrosine protein phosphatase [Anaerolineae bacterium]